DFGDICTPPFTHRALIEQAAERGLHVLCEKPLAPSLADAQGISEAVSAAQIVFQPCHQYHYSPDWQVVRRMLPRLGRIHFAEYDVHRTQANPGNPHWSPAWRTDPESAGGGILVDHGAHIFYQLRSILGEPKTVQATVRTLRHTSYGVEDTALVVLDFGDCLAQINLTWAGWRRQIQFRFVGERGELLGDDQGVRVLADVREHVDFGGGMSQGSSHSGWYTPLFRAFTERIRAEDRSRDALDEAVYVTRLITTAYESAMTGRTLTLAEPATGGLLTPAADSDRVLGDRPIEENEVVARADKGRRASLLRWGSAVVLLAAGVWTFHDVAWASLWSGLGKAKPGWIAIAAIVNLGAVALQAARWLALLRPLTLAANFASAFKSLILGFAFSTVLPARAGELARMQSMSRRTGLPPASVLGSIVLDHLVNAAGLLLGLAFLPFFLAVPLWIRPGAFATLALFTAAAALVFALRTTATRNVGRSRFLPLKVAGFLAMARQGLDATRRPKALALSAGASLGSWTLEASVVALAMRAVGLHLPFAAAFLVLLAVNLALAVPFAPPGNIGTIEVGATLALLGFGVAKEQALAFGIVYHLLQVVPVGALGILFATRNVDAPAPA
ncbi:MAG: flippase-like domain-containing protein, partial [Vicinamibacteria bacterium]